MVKKRKKGTSVDFAGVEAGGIAVPDGNYQAYPESVELTEAESSGNEMFKFKWKIIGPKCKGAVVWDNMVLVPQALWRLKGLLQVLGQEVPDGAMDLDPADLEGEDNTCTIEVTNEKYKNKDQPRITGFSEAGGEEDEEEEEEEETPKKKPKKKASKKDEDEDEDEDEEEEEEEDEEEDDPKPVKKKGKPDAKVGKPSKLKEGAKVTFEDDKGKTIRGTITEIDGDTIKVEDKAGDEWELEADQLELV